MTSRETGKINELSVCLGSDGVPFVMGGAHLSGLLGAGGHDVSPRVRWDPPTGVDVRSYALTVHDPDAPTASGFWHWVVFDIPGDCTELPEGAGSARSGEVAPPCVQARNDAGFPGYVGAAPPVGHGPHRYYFRVHALGVRSLGLGPDASPAMVDYTLRIHELARGAAMVIYEARP